MDKNMELLRKSGRRAICCDGKLLLFHCSNPNSSIEEKEDELFTMANWLGLFASTGQVMFPSCTPELCAFMGGHIDAVSSMAKNPNHLKGIFSGSMDGDIRLWNLANRRTVCQFPGHQGAVRGLTVSTDGRVLVSCGTDSTVRHWRVPIPSLMESDYSSDNVAKPLAVYVWKNAFWAVDHQWDGELFATAGAQVDIWNHNRSQPVKSFEWGKDTAISVRLYH